MSTVVISSDEEMEPTPPKKRIKLTKVEPDSSNSSANLEDNKENGRSIECIDSSDEENEENNHMPLSKKCKEKRSEYKSSGLEFFKDLPEINEYLTVCLEKITDKGQNKLFISKVDYLMKYYKLASKEYIESDEFNKTLDNSLEQAKNGDLLDVLNSFLDLTMQVKSAVQAAVEATPMDRTIRRLEKFLDRLKKRIELLEEEEVDFDKDENSSYIQMQRYRDRAAKVYAKICKYRKENPQSESMTHRRIDFSASNYTEINQAINKKFKTGEVFPTYFDIEKCIRKCVTKKNMSLSDAELAAEARHCFEKLGNLLQHRRRIDLHNVHCQYLTSREDPAQSDPQLNSQLIANRNKANEAINSICEKYVRLQEEGKDISVSSDSEDSHYNESEEEDSD